MAAPASDATTTGPARPRVDYSLFVERRGDGLTRIDLALESERDIAINEIERDLRATPGLDEARLNLTRRRVTLGWRDPGFDPLAAIDLIESHGLRVHPIRVDRGEEAEARHAQWLLKCLAVAAFAMMNIMLLSVSVWAGNVSDISDETRDFFHWLSALIAIPAAGYAGQPFFRSALAALKRGELNMDVPISIGVIGALAMSVYETAVSARHAYFDSAVMLLMFLLAGRYLEQAMRRRTRAEAGNLTALKGETARRLDAGGHPVTVPVAALAPGDEVQVAPGERAPADGVVATGRSHFDDGLITGETLLRPVREGDVVYAGGLNGEGALVVRVTRGGGHALIDEIEALLARAAEAKSRTLRLVDRVARLYAPVVHVAAALTALGWWLSGAGVHFAIVTAIAVLIITCPCALGLAVPAVQVVASGALFRAGVLLNAGDALERIAACDLVVFDKTGTLTTPDAVLIDREACDPRLLALAARLALSSRHPLAQALAREARRGEGDRRPLADAREEPGRGVAATIDGVEARLGARDFCGLPPAADDLPRRSECAGVAGRGASGRRRAGALGHRLPPWRRNRPVPHPPDPAGRRRADRRRAARAGSRRDHPLGRRARPGRGGRPRAWRRGLARGDEARRQDRLHRGAEARGPPPADGRRRPQRRARARRRPRLALAHRRRRSRPRAGRRRVPRRTSRPGADGGAHVAQGDAADPREPRHRRDLQYRRGAARHGGTVDAADRGGGDVWLVRHRHAQRAARPPRRGPRAVGLRRARRGPGARLAGGTGMNILVVLVPLALGIGLLGLAAFFWAMRNNQFDDPEGSARRILSDDDLPRDREEGR